MPSRTKAGTSAPIAAGRGPHARSAPRFGLAAKVGDGCQRIGVEGLRRLPRRLAQCFRLRSAGQAGRIQDLFRGNIQGQNRIDFFQRLQRRKEAGHQERLEVAYAQVDGGKLDVGRCIVAGRQEESLLPEHVADLVKLQAAQCGQPRLDVGLLGQAIERLVDSRVEEQLPVVEEHLAPRPLVEDLRVGTLQQNDALGQLLRGAKADLLAIGAEISNEGQEGRAGNDIGLAVRHAKTQPVQRGVQPHHPPQEPRQHEPRRRFDGSNRPLQLRQADPRIVSRCRRFATRAEPFPGLFHGGAWNLELSA